MPYYVYYILSYLFVSCSGSITSVGERELIFLLSFTYYVDFVTSFLFHLVLGIGYIILLWHSLGLPYNSFDKPAHTVVQLICAFVFRIPVCKKQVF